MEELSWQQREDPRGLLVVILLLFLPREPSPLLHSGHIISSERAPREQARRLGPRGRKEQNVKFLRVWAVARGQETLIELIASFRVSPFQRGNPSSLQ